MKLLFLRQFCQRHLPFVVVSAVSVCASGMIFSANVNAKVVDAVVGLVAVHVVDTLGSEQGASKVLGHNPAMLQNTRGGGAGHGAEHGHVRSSDHAGAQFYVPTRRFSATQTFLVTPTNVPSAQSVASARKAMTRKVFAFQELAQSPQWIPALFFASWARNASAPSTSSVHLAQFIAPADSWMFGERRWIKRATSHVSSPSFESSITHDFANVLDNNTANVLRLVLDMQLLD